MMYNTCVCKCVLGTLSTLLFSLLCVCVYVVPLTLTGGCTFLCSLLVWRLSFSWDRQEGFHMRVYTSSTCSIFSVCVSYVVVFSCPLALSLSLSCWCALYKGERAENFISKARLSPLHSLAFAHNKLPTFLFSPPPVRGARCSTYASIKRHYGRTYRHIKVKKGYATYIQRERALIYLHVHTRLLRKGQVSL